MSAAKTKAQEIIDNNGVGKAHPIQGDITSCLLLREADYWYHVMLTLF